MGPSAKLGGNPGATPSSGRLPSPKPFGTQRLLFSPLSLREKERAVTSTWGLHCQTSTGGDCVEVGTPSDVRPIWIAPNALDEGVFEDGCGTTSCVQPRLLPPCPLSSGHVQRRPWFDGAVAAVDVLELVRCRVKAGCRHAGAVEEEPLRPGCGRCGRLLLRLNKAAAAAAAPVSTSPSCKHAAEAIDGLPHRGVEVETEMLGHGVALCQRGGVVRLWGQGSGPDRPHEFLWHRGLLPRSKSADLVKVSAVVKHQHFLVLRKNHGVDGVCPCTQDSSLLRKRHRCGQEGIEHLRVGVEGRQLAAFPGQLPLQLRRLLVMLALRVLVLVLAGGGDTGTIVEAVNVALDSLAVKVPERNVCCPAQQASPSSISTPTLTPTASF